MRKNILLCLGVINLLVVTICLINIYEHNPSISFFIYLIFILAISVILTDKYKIKYIGEYLSYHLMPVVKAFIIMIILLIPYAIWNHEEATVRIFFKIFVCTTAVDLVSRYLYFKINRKKNAEEVTLEFANYDPNFQETLGFEDDKVVSIGGIKIYSKISDDELSKIANYLDEMNIGFNVEESSPIYVDTYNKIVVENNPKNDLFYLKFIINNLRFIGKKLNWIALNSNAGGWLLTRYIPLELVEQKVKSKTLGNILYVFYFVYKRVFPKIPYLNRIYFVLTKGNNRSISRTEVWGRLMYFGFNVEKEIESNGSVLLLARRIKSISPNKNPSFYPLIKLNRIGYMGKVFQTNKIRSMYPFSEFLQQRVFEENGMSSDGHFVNDSRITKYGRFIRKYWLDEMPQIFDWLKGNIKLVGLRAMSIQYYNIHSKQYREKFVRVMPGLIPPIFDTNNKSFDQISKIEEDYLDSYSNNRIKTDFDCFISTVKLILFKKVRSS